MYYDYYHHHKSTGRKACDPSLHRLLWTATSQAAAGKACAERRFQIVDILVAIVEPR